MTRASATVLVVEDEIDMLKGIAKMLAREGYDVEEASTGTEAVQKLEQKAYNVVVTDLKLQGCSGLDVLRRLKEVNPDSEGIVITGFGTVETAVEAMKLGAYDFITKPFDMKKVKIVVRNALEQSNLVSENRYLRQRIDTEWQVEQLVSESPAMKAVVEAIQKVAPTNATVIITGEGGTGKEFVARAIHSLSPRRDKLFLAVNCGVLRDVYLESELFGHVKGAFKEATSARRGMLESAHGGTLFMEGIAEMSPAIQAKLLDILKGRAFRRIGATEEIHADLRFIAASNRDLEECVSQKTFSEELYGRLNASPIAMPPLRERPEDIPLLTRLFLERHARRLGKKVNGISAEAMDALLSHHWPGNVRELANAIERALILAGGEILSLDDLPRRLLAGGGSVRGAGAASQDYG